jgi:dethiobiotin synthetase/malonyl-CoA O-methyltransferase
MTGVFVTGTDTGVGKTMVSAWLTAAWGADYWKPVQTGTRQEWDADVIRDVAPGAVIHDSVYALPEPLSPHAAAALAGIVIDLAAFHLPVTPRPLVVEGAGGVLVPLNDRDRMVDLMVHLGLPIVVVARSGLGTINHTLLTLEALARRGVPIAGVILNGPPNPGNRAAIIAYGQVPVVAHLPPLSGPGDLAALPAPDLSLLTGHHS